MPRWLFALAVACLVPGVARVTTQQPAAPPKPTLYVVATAHLDTQWNWTVQDTIRQYVPSTFFDNFALIEKYPHYTFTFEGAIHYMWFKEYHPEAWPTLQKYVADGRWRLAGSWIDAVDVHMPSPESVMRQALYGKRFFRQEFKTVSRDVYLPDCFGFGFALPSIAAHSGLSAFSTQKLTWGRPIPFPVGRWKGVDGSEVVAALRPGDYVMKLTSDISTDPKWTDDVVPVGNGRAVGLRYFGVGDTGGAPDAASVEWLEKAIANPAGKVEIRNTSADQLSRDLTADEKAALPGYEGELLLKTHGTGCYTSQAALKRWNRQNELLADAAERASVAAEWLAGLPYPRERLRDAWLKVLWHQFHDDLTGTSIPQAYQFSWNDQLAAANQFAGVLTSASSAVSSLLDTQATGVPLVVYNPLAATRRDAVEATVRFPGEGAAPESVRVVDGITGQAVPVQVLETSGRDVRILFLADVPSVGFKVFDVQTGPGRAPASPTLRVTSSSLENGRYRVLINSAGDIASVVDKGAKKELLKAPVRLELRDNPSPSWPAWEILYDSVRAPARETVGGLPVVRIVERGPVRVSLEITRKAAGSTFVQRVRLTDGGDRVEVENLVDWQSPNTLLKAAFPLAASNPKATYDLGLGTVARGNDEPDQYEVPAQQWADLTDASGTFGAAIMNDSKYGWDKPDDNTLRLTLLHTPRPTKNYTYQSSNDLGRHHFVYAIAGHASDWRAGRVPARAAALNQPLVAFQAVPHAGTLGRRFSMLSLEDPEGQVAVRALKKAEDEDAIVLRVQELYGRPAHVRLTLAAPAASVREINAAEETVGAFSAPNGALVIDLKPYQPRTFSLDLGRSSSAPPERRSIPIQLPFNLDGISNPDGRADGDIDGLQQTLAGELLPREIELDGVVFKLGSSAAGEQNVLVPKGQRLVLPPGSADRLYLLAAAVGGDLTTTLTVGPNRARTLTVREWQGPVGQWDSRLKAPRLLQELVTPPPGGRLWTRDAVAADLVVGFDAATGAVSGIDQIHPGYVKRDEIAWIGTHRHGPAGDQPYVASYLFAYAIDLPADTREIRLPVEPRLRILAATVVREPARVRPAGPLYAADLPDVAVAPSR